MSTAKAAIGTTAFLALASTVELGVGPYVLTGWHEGPWPAPSPVTRALGALLVVAGLAALLATFWRFVVEGVGTPTPLAPPRRLVIGGIYRWMRNPMYVASAVAIAGQGVLLSQPILLAAAAVYLLALGSWCHWVEEPQLARRFGAAYAEYRRAVPGWWPRRRPWRR